MSMATVRLPGGRLLTGRVIDWLPNSCATVELDGARYTGRRVLRHGEPPDSPTLGASRDRLYSAVYRQPRVDAGSRDAGTAGLWGVVVLTAGWAVLGLFLGLPVAATLPVACLIGVAVALVDHWAAQRIMRELSRADTWQLDTPDGL